MHIKFGRLLLLAENKSSGLSYKPIPLEDLNEGNLLKMSYGLFCSFGRSK